MKVAPFLWPTVYIFLTDAVFAVDSKEISRTTAALVTSDDVRTDVFTPTVVDCALVCI